MVNLIVISFCKTIYSVTLACFSVILIYPHSLFSYFTILSVMTAVTFPLRPPSLAFSICGRRSQNDVYEIKYSVWRWLIRRCQGRARQVMPFTFTKKTGWHTFSPFRDAVRAIPPLSVCWPLPSPLSQIDEWCLCLQWTHVPRLRHWGAWCLDPVQSKHSFLFCKICQRSAGDVILSHSQDLCVTQSQ